MGRKKGSKRFLPWPIEAEAAYRQIVETHRVMAGDIATSIERGTKARNKYMVEAMADYIIQGATGLEDSCQIILDLLDEYKTGRPPKWFTITQEIQDRASKIHDLMQEKVKPALVNNRMIVVAGVYERLQIEVDCIAKLLKEHPYRAEISGLEIWDEVAKTVNEAFKK